MIQQNLRIRGLQERAFDEPDFLKESVSASAVNLDVSPGVESISIPLTPVKSEES